jgi:hypothetical protein
MLLHTIVVILFSTKLLKQEAVQRKKYWRQFSGQNNKSLDLRRRSLSGIDSSGEDVFDERYKSGASTPVSTLSGYRDPDLEPMDTIFVKNVQEGGPAHRAGLVKGELSTSF